MPDAAIALKNFLCLCFGSIEIIFALNIFNLFLHAGSQFKIFMNDQVVDGGIIAQFAEMYFNLLNGSLCQRKIINKVPGRCLVKLLGSLFYYFF